MTTFTVSLDESAIAYVRSQVSSACEWGAPLSQRLLDVSISDAFAILSPKVHDRARSDFIGGGVDSEVADDLFASAISRWLSGSESDDVRRMLILEDVMSRRTDPVVNEADDVFFGDRVYLVASGGSDANSVAAEMSKLYGYPGVGVLSRVGGTGFSSRTLTSTDIELAADGAVAVVARAWDDEAFVIAPIDGRLTIDELGNFLADSGRA